MRTRIVYSLGWSLGLLVLAAGLPSCDNVDVGRLAEDKEAPVVLRILVQEANSGQITDLLNKAAALKCSDTNPCPVGTAGLGPTTCTIPDGMTEGTCDNPTSADNEIVIGDAGTTQIRIITSKHLAPDVEKVTVDPMTKAKTIELADPSAFGLFGPDGKEVAADAKYVDNSGTAYDSADPFGEPLGPALVINVSNPLSVASTYTVKVNGAVLKDTLGQAITKDIAGPLAGSYTFKTEGLYATGNTPKLSAVAPNDVISVTTNADVDPASLKLTIKDGNGATVPNGVAFLDLDDKTCDPTGARSINLFITDASGNPGMWMPGATYTLTLEAKDADTGKTALDGFADQKITVGMTAGDPAKDKQAVDNFLLPAPCNNALHPPDGGTTD